jgi:hypothetical protein
MFKRFRLPTDSEVWISNTLGHSVTLSKSFTEVHNSLWAQAYTVGAIAEDAKLIHSSYIEEKKEEIKSQELQEREDIKAQMKVILDNPTQYLRADSSLHYQKVVSLLKKAYKKDYLEGIWKEIVEEAK